MPSLRLPLTLLLLGLALAAARLAHADDSPHLPAQVEVPAMKTSIYLGTVTLQTTPFTRTGDTWTAAYEARVFPWSFWSEHGDIAIVLPEADLARLCRGETVNFTGDARNHKGRPRAVTGRAMPGDAATGRIKVRIRVDGVELVFAGDYRFAPTAAPPP